MIKRPLCETCLRPLKTCICKHVQPIENLVSLIILQHPLETHEAKNTGHLLHLCLKNSQIFIGESFESHFAPLLDAHKFKDLLLYPSTPDLIPQKLLISSTRDGLRLNIADLQGSDDPKPLRLWVIDATWRKSRKMLYLNGFLQTMPRLSLDNCPSSLYTIRKAHSENQLSTLEASCYALQTLEANTVDYSPVLHAFNAFVAEQQTFLPSSK